MPLAGLGGRAGRVGMPAGRTGRAGRLGMADWGFGAGVLASLGVDDWVVRSPPVHRPGRTSGFDEITVRAHSVQP